MLPWLATINKDRHQKNPAFTAGGSSEAEIATPTRDPALPPRTLNNNLRETNLIDSIYLKATPAPLGTATMTPTQSERS